MNWTEVISYKKGKKSVLDLVEIEDSEKVGKKSVVHPLISLTISIIEKMLESGEKKQVIVLPEREAAGFIIAVLLNINRIIDRNSESNYNPYDFEKGQLLKYENCIVEFAGIEKLYDKEYIKVKCSNGYYSLPLEVSPYFQKTETKKSLLKLERVNLTKKKIVEDELSVKAILHSVQNLRTHLDGKVFYVSTINQTLDYIGRVSFNGIPLEELLLIGRIQQNGTIANINKGKLSGTPTLSVATDLHSITKALRLHNSAELLVIDSTNISTTVNNELPLLKEEILNTGLPVVVLTDTISSFDLDSIEEHGFCIWRWNEQTIPRELCNDDEGILKVFARKTKNCSKLEQNYIYCNDERLNKIIKSLYEIRKEVTEEGQGTDIIDLYSRLWNITYSIIQNISSFNLNHFSMSSDDIIEYKKALKLQKGYISSTTIYKISDIINSLANLVCCSDSYTVKADALKTHLFEDTNYEIINIVVSDRTDVTMLKKYWDEQMSKAGKPHTLRIFTANQFIMTEEAGEYPTIICGWLGNLTMRKILYGYNCSNYTILLYNCERPWQIAHINSWDRAFLLNSNNKVLKLLNIDEEKLFSTVQKGPIPQDIDANTIDEIDMIIRENRYRKYQSFYSQENSDPVESIPVTFAGGSIALFGLTKRLVSVTGIIIGTHTKIDSITPDQLIPGDFIVIRETEKDIIREIADVFLTNSGYSNARKIASEWREALNVAIIFNTHEEIYNRIKTAGCKKSFNTIKQWLENDEMIAPHDREDLIYIAKATGDTSLENRCDEIFDAIRIVRSAHLRAGDYLSSQISVKIPISLKNIGIIDPYSIMSEIELKLDVIGTVKILKVIDIGEKILVNRNYINRLTRE